MIVTDGAVVKIPCAGVSMKTSNRLQGVPGTAQNQPASVRQLGLQPRPAPSK